MRHALPTVSGWETFDALHDAPEQWIDVVRSIGARYSTAPVVAATEGSVLVGLVGDEAVVKLYPPFLRDHFEFEHAVLLRLHGRLRVPTPRLLDRIDHEGWPGLVMTRLQGRALTQAWPALGEAAKCEVLSTLGHLAAEVHALPVGDVAALAPPWPRFIESQRARCRARHARLGMPARLLEALEPFVQGVLPAGPAVILTGEYTPMNLLYDGGVCGMYDFGDGLVGPAQYDWLGPLCFLAAGHRDRCDAFLAGYGAPAGRDWRLPCLRMLLLHRYSHPRAQIAMKGWESAGSFEEVAERIWP